MPNVQHALAFLGENHSEYKQRLQEILKWYRSNGKTPYLPGALFPQDSATDGHLPVDTQVEPTLSELRTKGLGMQRIIRTPVVNLPSSLLPQSNADFYQYGHPERPLSPYVPTPWAIPPSPELEDISETESTNSEDLDSELEDEEELDQHDMVSAKSLEEELWSLLGGDPAISAECRVEVVKQPGKRKRAASQSEPEGAQKKVRSQSQPKPAKPRRRYTVRSKVTKVSKRLDAPKRSKPGPKPKPKPKPSKPPTQSARKKHKSKEIISDSD